MDIIVLLVVVVVVLAIAIYGIQNLPIVEGPWKNILIALACLFAVLVILSRSGLVRAVPWL